MREESCRCSVCRKPADSFHYHWRLVRVTFKWGRYLCKRITGLEKGQRKHQ